MAKRVVVLIDMDCFYVQVEQREKPELLGKPTAVAQYNKWQGGGIIAVGYEARACNVRRGMRGNEALSLCPELNVVQVPCRSGKADLTKYRNASRQVFQALSAFPVVLERASIDEAYLDCSECVEDELAAIRAGQRPLDSSRFVDTHLAVAGCSSDRQTDVERLLSEANDYMRSGRQDAAMEMLLRILIGAAVAYRVRQKILETTGFKASAGIAWNKMLAKLVCGLNKPNKQTLILPDMVSELFSKTRIKDVRMLGGKLGALLATHFNVETMEQLREKATVNSLRAVVKDRAEWIDALCHGIDVEPVTNRCLPKSIGCSKNFPGKQSLATGTSVKQWLRHLSAELEDRLRKDQQDNGRTAKLLVVTVASAGPTSSCNRSCQLRSYDADSIVEDALAAISRLNRNAGSPTDSWEPALTTLGIAATRFDHTAGQSISSYLKPMSPMQDEAVDESYLEQYALELKAVMANLRIPAPAGSAQGAEHSDGRACTSTVSDEMRGMNDTVAWLNGSEAEHFPDDPSKVPEDVWKALPPELRWELKHDMRKRAGGGTDPCQDKLPVKKRRLGKGRPSNGKKP